MQQHPSVSTPHSDSPLPLSMPVLVHPNGLEVCRFFIRDSILFPDAIHAQKRNPKTGLKDANAFWDFMAHTPETAHALLMTFGDRGIPFRYIR